MITASAGGRNVHIPGGSVCSCVAPSLGVLGLALLSSPHMQRFECLYVYFGFCHAATRCTLQLAATTTVTECIKKKNKKPEKQEPTQNHYPFSVSLLFVKKKKNHPESPGKNHVTYPRKAVPVITGYGLSTSLAINSSFFSRCTIS